jgi:hypothetical protein
MSLNYPKNKVSEMRCGTVISLIALCLLYVHFLLTVVSKEGFWGIDFVTYLPQWGIVGFYLLAVIACFPFVKFKIPTLNSKLLIVIIGTMSFLYFYFVRFKYGFIGDNYLHVGQIERCDWQRIADGRGVGFIMCMFYKLIAHPILNLNAFKSIQIFSVLCGVGYSIYVFKIARELGRNTFEKITLFFACMLLPLSCEFNGLIEIHALPTVVMVAIYYYSILVLNRKISIWVPVILFLISSALHLLILTTLPAILYLFYERISQTKKKPILFTSCALSLLMILIFWSKLKFNSEINAFTISEFVNGQLLAFGSLILGLVIIFINIFHIKKTTLLTFFIMMSILQLGFYFCYNLLFGAVVDDLVFYPSFTGAIAILLCLFQLKSFICIHTVKIMTGLLVLNLTCWMLIHSSDMSIIWYETNIQKNAFEASYYKNHPMHMVMGMTFESNRLIDKAIVHYRLLGKR